MIEIQFKGQVKIQDWLQIIAINGAIALVILLVIVVMFSITYIILGNSLAKLYPTLSAIWIGFVV